MALGNALQIGRSGLIASRTAIEVAGNNLTNIATRGYHRQSISLAPVRDQQFAQGIFIGRGVQVQQILRHVDEALEGRIRNGIADQAASAAKREILSQIEALENEFSDIDLSTHLSAFFNAWSELANNPDDNSLRSLVVHEGRSLAQFVQTLHGGLRDLRDQVDKGIDGAVTAADDLLLRIEHLNQQIMTQDGGTGGAHALRDERDLALASLAEYLDISVVEQSSGAVDFFVGSLPVVLNARSRGLDVQRDTINGQLQISVQITDDDSALNPTTGRIGALLAARDGDVSDAIDALNGFANELIYQVNRVHSQGQGLQLHDSVTGGYRVADATVALNDPAAGVAFDVNHGSFQVHLTQKSTGQRTTNTVAVDLDGIGSDTTLTDLAAAISALPNLSGAITPDGRLQITPSGSDFAIGFSDDSSGALAALGINTYFTGVDANDIAVDPLVDNLGFIATSQDHNPGDNANALAMSGLSTQPLASLNNVSLTEQWSRHVEDFAVRLGASQAQLEADAIVRENLEEQQQRISGVNADEEAINLLTFQRSFQGSARYLQIVDELIETLLTLI